MSAPSDDSARILLADDQVDVLKALQLLLKGRGYRSETVSSPAAVLAALRAREFDAAIVDMNYARDTSSGREGLALLEEIARIDPELPVIVLTAYGSVELAVEAMRRGARDFVQKPWENERLLNVVRAQLEIGRTRKEKRLLEAENRVLRDSAAEPAQLLARSRAMAPVLELVRRVGPSDAHVLITGENGSGKGVVARALHAASERAGRPLITVNAGGLAESVFESELFGHVRGSFTDASADRVGRFELAQGGTLFLDEIANIPLALQAKLLRVIESGEYERLGSSRTLRADARLVSATNADLAEEVQSGRFRKDLLFRLNTIEIRVPPLRERGEDIPVLAAHFLRAHARRYKKNLTGFDARANAALLAHPWPGNVRELDHAVERSVLMARHDPVGAADLALEMPAAWSAAVAPSAEERTLAQAELEMIERALARHRGNVLQAARSLGLSRSGFYRRLDKHGLPRNVEGP